MTKAYTSKEIKNRLSNIGEAIGNIALEYIAELEEKISVLLSCKNCPENKGGYICQKEYEGKCLTQKTQYIKELQEENAELKARIEKQDADILTLKGLSERQRDQLTKAKEIMQIAIKGISHQGIVGGTERPFEKQAELEFNLFLEKAEQFLNSEVER